MIDLHCHVLPGIDDGPRDDAGAAALLEALAADGIHTVAATPHFRHDHPGVTPDAVRDGAKHLRPLASGLAVIPAGEVSVTWALNAPEEDLKAASYGRRGSDILVECPDGEIPFRLADLVFELRERGFRVLLAHPERNQGFQSEPAQLGELLAAGVLVQLNAESLLEGRGSRTRRLALALLREKMAHVIASDAHSADVRPPRLAEAVAVAERAVGARARWMVEDVPAALLAGAPLPAAPR